MRKLKGSKVAIDDADLHVHPAYDYPANLMVIPTLIIIAGLTWMWGLIFVRYEGQQRGAQARPMLIMMSLMAGLATLYALAFIVFMMRQDAW